MPFILALLGGLSSVAGSLVGRVLLALGMGFATYQGLDTSITWLLDYIKDSVGAMPVQIVRFLAFLWVDKAIMMLFSAYAAATFIKFAGSSTVTKLVMKS